MEYQHEIEVNLSLSRVIELFDNPDNMGQWQPGLISFETISGTPSEVGAKSLLKYKMGNREVEMVETITEKELPHKFAGTYEAKSVKNWITNTFEEIGPDKTRWTSHNTIKCSGMMKIWALLMPGTFKKQSYKFMVYFKEYAEKA